MALIALLACARSALLVLAQVPLWFDQLSWRAQLLIMRTLEHGVLQNGAYLVCTVVAIPLLTAQVRKYRRQADSREDAVRRGRMVATGLAWGFGPTLVAILLQVITLLLRHKLFTPLQMSLLIMPLALVPVSLAYALLARRVDTLGILARRAALFAVAERTINAITVLPLLILAWALYAHRTEPLGEVFAGRPVTLTITVIATIITLRYARGAHDLLERLFLRERRDARRVLRELTETSRNASDPTELTHLLIREIDRAFHLESIALFVRDPATETFAMPGSSLPPLDASSTIVTLLLRRPEILDVDLDRPRSPLRRLSDLERHWLTEGQVRLIVPLVASDGSLLAILAVGEKMDELPFAREDRLLLTDVAASAALALETRLLRTRRRDSGEWVLRSADAIAPSDVAHRCPECRRLFSPLLRVTCPDDDQRLIPSTVP